jgi:hypothetical protein
MHDLTIDIIEIKKSRPLIYKSFDYLNWYGA